MLVSFILPVYNVQPYLIRCLDSIYGQGINETMFEVVAVNDGSTDESLSVIEQYSKKHSNLVIYSQKNGGVSSARNKGIKLAQGNYLLFVDPDDYLTNRSLNHVFSDLKSRESDIVIYRCKTSDTDKFIFDWKGLIDEDKDYTGIELFGLYSRGCCWGCAISNKLIESNNIVFPLGVRNGEDSIFMSTCMAISERISFLDVDYYTLFRRENSASQQITNVSINRMRNTLDAINYLRQSESFSSYQKQYFEKLTYGAISSLTTMAMLVPSLSYVQLCHIVPVQNYLPIRHNKLFKQRFKIVLVNKSYHLFYILCKIKSFFKKPRFI